MAAPARLLLAVAVAAVFAACGPGDGGPAGAADEGRLYVASGLTDEILVLDPATSDPIKQIPVDRRRDELDEPHGLAASPDGRHWYATVSHGEPTLWKFEVGTDRLVGRVTLPAGGAARIGITPDSRRAFVPDYDRSSPGSDGLVAAVDLETLEVVGVPSVCPGPHHAAVHPAGQMVAVSCSLSDEIALMDARSLTVLRKFSVDEEPGDRGQPRFKPLNLAWSPDGEVLYASLHLAARVRAFDSNGAVLGTVDVGAGPAQIELTPDGSMLVSANRGDGSMSIISASPLAETGRVNLSASHPHGIAVDAAGRRAFVACEGDVDTPGRIVAVDLQSREILWSVEAGAYLLGALFR